jgi:hemoglobin
MSLYEKLGGGPAVFALVAEFYRRVLADPELSPYFRELSQERLINHQADFLTQVLGGPAAQEIDLTAAARPLAIRDSDFRLLLNHLGDALRLRGIADADHEAVLNVVTGFRLQIVESRSAHRIVALDDSRTWLAALESRLPAGVTLVPTLDWPSFVKELERGRTDLALVDVHMPNVDGFEVLTRLHADSRFSKIPVALCTSRASPALQLQATKLGAIDVIAKHLEASVFSAKLAAIVEKIDARKELSHAC